MVKIAIISAVFMLFLLLTYFTAQKLIYLFIIRLP